MKFLTLLALPAVVLAQTKTTPDVAGLSKTISEAVPSMSFCANAIKLYKAPGGTTSLSSFESACSYFESMYVPPVQKALESVVSAETSSLSGLGEIKDSLTKLLGHFDKFAENSVGRDEDLRFVACQFITGDKQPSGETVQQMPNLGEPTIKMLKTIAEQLKRANALPELATKAGDYASKMEAGFKAIRPTCRGSSSGGSSSAGSSTTAKPSSSTTSASVPTGTGGSAPSKPSSGSLFPLPSNIVTAGASSIAPQMVMGVCAIGALFVL